jgi:hypothetical protein
LVISGFTQQFQGTKHTTLPHLSVHNRGRNFAEIYSITHSKPSLKIFWLLPYRRLNLPTLSKMELH